MIDTDIDWAASITGVLKEVRRLWRRDPEFTKTMCRVYCWSILFVATLAGMCWLYINYIEGFLAASIIVLGGIFGFWAMYWVNGGYDGYDEDGYYY